MMNQQIIDEFMRYGQAHLAKGIEFCAILCGTAWEDGYMCSHLLIPRQTGTRDSCSAVNEVELFEYQFDHDLITLGWIHVCLISLY
jgi:STAM-binding protein